MTQTRLQHLRAYQAMNAAPSRPSLSNRDKSRYYVSNGPKSVCWACLNEHDSTTCQHKRCYRCAKPGHESAQCTSVEYCDHCGQNGHSQASQCYRQVYNMGLDPRQHEEVQCYVCGEMGHISCHAAQRAHRSPHKRRRDDY